jgi:hypothetical protein
MGVLEATKHLVLAISIETRTNLLQWESELGHGITKAHGVWVFGQHQFQTRRHECIITAGWFTYNLDTECF